MLKSMRLRPLKTLSVVFTILTIILVFPATIILASWNSLPDSKLYSVKRKLEKLALNILPPSTLEMQLRFKLLDRRVIEANSVIIQKGFDNPFKEIVGEAKSAQLAIVELSPDLQSQAALQLIAELYQITSELENILLAVETEISKPTNLATQSELKQAQDLITFIKETQIEIEVIITSLKQPSSPIDTDTNANNDNEVKKD